MLSCKTPVCTENLANFFAITCDWLVFCYRRDYTVRSANGTVISNAERITMKDYTKLSHEEKEALVQYAVKVAFDTETDHGNCTQSSLYGLYCAFPDMGITDEMLKGSFGLAGGCGCSLLGTCGALNAAAWAISLFYGRPADDLSGDYEACHAMIRDVVEKFRVRYEGNFLCSDVLTYNMGAPYDWKTPQGLLDYNAHDGTFHCATAVAFCTEIIARMIVNGELKYPEA